MRKLLSIACMMVALLLASCSAPTPKDVAMDFFEKMLTGDMESATEHIAFNSDDPEEIEKGKALLTAMMSEKLDGVVKKHEGIKDIQFVSETISEDGLTAEVEAKAFYNDGKEDDIKTGLKKVNDEWKVVMDK